MDRESVTACVQQINKITKAVESLPYREARQAITELEELEGIIGEELSGGYFGLCISCEQATGNDEVVSAGDEYICATCVDRWNESAAQ